MLVLYIHDMGGNASVVNVAGNIWFTTQLFRDVARVYLDFSFASYVLEIVNSMANITIYSTIR